MEPKIGLQLYTLREALATDFAGTMRQVADSGFSGVETWSDLIDATLDHMPLLADLGLNVFGAHYDLPLGGDKQRVLETMARLGCNNVVLSYIDPAYYTNMAGVEQVAAKLNEASAVAQTHGLTLHYHNHDFELQPLDGRPALQTLLELTDPAVKFELDVYWIRTAGLDPAAFVQQLGARSPLLHIKDGTARSRDDAMTALGQGVIDVPAVVAAGSPHTEWLVVELDRCDTDMMTAVRESYAYLARLPLG